MSLFVTGTRPIPAAGAVLWRRDDDARLRVAVAHRPRYDDWSLPKGKLDPGEILPCTAVREVLEETGFEVELGRHIGRVRYTVDGRSGPAEKSVDYFSGRAISGEFTPNDEVDELRWLPPEDAERLLSHDGDVGVLRKFRELPAELTTVLLVRHAKAGKRESWDGDDDLRPLSPAGLRQATALADVLPVYRPVRVVSAPRARCVQTVQAVADRLGMAVRPEPLLSEEGYWPDRELGLARLLAIAGEGGTSVVSSQGAVIPDLVGTLARSEGIWLDDVDHGHGVPSKKGSFWVLSFRPATGGTWPRLASADYFASPLPIPAPGRT